MKFLGTPSSFKAKCFSTVLVGLALALGGGRTAAQVSQTGLTLLSASLQSVDETEAVQAQLNDPATPLVRLSGTHWVRGLTVPAGKRLVGEAGQLLALPGSHGSFVTLERGASLEGVTLDGSAAGTESFHAVFSSASGVRVKRVHIRDFSGKGIKLARADHYLLTGNTIERVGAQAIDLDAAGSGQVLSNSVSGAEHGIQWWGGDSARELVPGVSNIVIRGNSVSGVRGGGIWGSLGTAIVVDHNRVQACGDVGIDFEGSTGSIMANVVGGTRNGAIAFFYGAHDVHVEGNTLETSQGAGLWFTTRHGNHHIVIARNTLTVRGESLGVQADPGSSGQVSFVNNSVITDRADFMRGHEGWTLADNSVSPLLVASAEQAVR